MVLPGCFISQKSIKDADGDGVVDRRDIEVNQVPEELLNASVCIYNNVTSSPITVKAGFTTTAPIVETVQYEQKTCQRIPDSEGDSIMYEIWARTTPVVYLQQVLARKHYYQVYINRLTNKLEVAEIPR
jgi:hypothetical protein